jgi:glycosyltransferase involved in cell wall biosynthesis
VRYVATTKTRDWGHSQVNYGLQHVKGDYVTYQDDDDIYLPRALDEMGTLMDAMPVKQPLVGRVKTPAMGLLWQKPGTEACLDGHCVVLPNDKKKLGWMTKHHHGDQGFLNTSLCHYEDVSWVDRVWTLTRPHWKLTVWNQAHNANWWHWSFYREGVVMPVASLVLTKDPDSDRMIASITRNDDVTRDELVEICEFAVYACQGNDCWLRFDKADDVLLIGALREAKFDEHTQTEYTHDWPPHFWPPFSDFNELLNQDGERIDDYRDNVWGARPV